MPGAYGLGAGEFPVPGFTYSHQATYYTASRLNDASGNAIAAVTGMYSFWQSGGQFQYVPKKKFLGGYYTPYLDIGFATSSTVADITGTDLGSASGGSGLDDAFIAPLVGYDQWQVSRNSGITSRLPPYAVDAIGGQINYILPAINAEFTLKYYDEVSARARPQGQTLVFGASWTRAAK